MGEVKSFCAWSYLAAKVCTYCSRRLSFFGGRSDSKVKDHIVPLSRGGEDIPVNIVACCKECHLLKGDYLNDVFFPLLLDRPRLVADIRRYLKEVRQVIGVRSSISDLPR
ncbi:MAG: HNH endonuclease signature motif containing protein [Deltaproteobacteria bacterium]|nr:HNH endonuclease signature motif containing protein [Deltaproteobacteria bacterium]